METVSYKLINQKGKEVGKLDLSKKLFGAEINSALVHETVRWQLAKRRAGTHATLTRSNMKGGGKKPWKQKGTGNARAGSIISPIWVGGAVVFGPQPRSYDYRLPHRTRAQSLASVLSSKVNEEGLVVVDKFEVNSGKSSDMVQVLKELGLGKKSVLMVVSDDKSTNMTVRAARNLKNVTILNVAGLNCFDILRHQYLLLDSKTLELVEKRAA